MQSAVTLHIEDVRILFVEDNADDYEIVSHLAERIGGYIKLERANTGTDALKKLKENDYDMIFLDYRLPDMDGLEFMRRIDCPGVPIVFLTGKGNERVAVEAVKRGACDYIRKEDINERTLADIIESNKKLIELHGREKTVEVKRKRDSFSITMSILSNATEGVRKTQLVYKTNLNFGTMNRYLRVLIKNGLVSSYMLDGNEHYRTTKKGISFLRELEKIEKLLL